MKLMQETIWKYVVMWEAISAIWSLIVSPSSVKAAKENLFKWLTTNFVSLDKEARVKLLENVSSCSDGVKDVIGSSKPAWNIQYDSSDLDD